MWKLLKPDKANLNGDLSSEKFILLSHITQSCVVRTEVLVKVSYEIRLTNKYKRHPSTFIE